MLWKKAVSNIPFLSAQNATAKLLNDFFTPHTRGLRHYLGHCMLLARLQQAGWAIGERPHSSLGYLTPPESEQEFYWKRPFFFSP
ncbi:MAG: hypothetical protein AAF614_19765 [Chloroflexota bacterium]